MRRIFGPCSACYEGHATLPLDTIVAMLVTAVGELLHADIIEFKEVTIGGNKYKLTVLDDYSTYVSCPGMKNKSKTSVLLAIKSAIAFYNQYRHITKSVLCDHERVLLSVKVELFELGIKLLDTIPGLHERKLERPIGTLKRIERTMSCDLDSTICPGWRTRLRCCRPISTRSLVKRLSVVLRLKL